MQSIEIDFEKDFGYKPTSVSNNLIFEFSVGGAEYVDLSLYDVEVAHPLQRLYFTIKDKEEIVYEAEVELSFYYYVSGSTNMEIESSSIYIEPNEIDYEDFKNITFKIDKIKNVLKKLMEITFINETETFNMLLKK